MLWFQVAREPNKARQGKAQDNKKQDIRSVMNETRAEGVIWYARSVKCYLVVGTCH